MFVIAWTCAGSAPPVPASVEPAVRPSEFVAGSSEDRSGVSAEVSVELPSVLADRRGHQRVRGRGPRLTARTAVGGPSAEDSASLKLVDPVPVVPVRGAQRTRPVPRSCSR